MKTKLLTFSFLVINFLRLHAQTSQDYYDKAFNAQIHKQWPIAISNYTLALEDTLTKLRADLVPKAYNNRGFCRFSSGKVQQAIEDYDMAIRINLKYDVAYQNRGIAFYSLDSFERAILDFDTVATIAPTTAASSLSYQGLAKYKLKKYSQAVEDFKQSLYKSNDMVDNYKYIGNCLYEMNEDTAALRNYYRYLHYKSDEMPIFETIGNIHNRMSLPDSALIYYEKVLTLSKMQTCEMCYKIGNIYLGHFQYKQALNQYQRAIICNGNIKKYRDKLDSTMFLLATHFDKKSDSAYIAQNFSFSMRYIDSVTTYHRLERALNRRSNIMEIYSEKYINKCDSLLKLSNFNIANIMLDSAIYYNAQNSDIDLYRKKISDNSAEYYLKKSLAAKEEKEYVNSLMLMDSTFIFNKDFAEGIAETGNILKEIRRENKYVLKVDTLIKEDTLIKRIVTYHPKADSLSSLTDGINNSQRILDSMVVNTQEIIKVIKLDSTWVSDGIAINWIAPNPSDSLAESKDKIYFLEVCIKNTDIRLKHRLYLNNKLVHIESNALVFNKKITEENDCVYNYYAKISLADNINVVDFVVYSNDIVLSSMRKVKKTK